MSGAGERRERVVLVVVCGLLLAAALAQLGFVGWRLGFDGEVTPSESESLLGLRLATKGEPVYHDYRQPPHMVTQYTPLFYYLPGWLARAARADILTTFLIGRAWTFLLWLGVAGMIWLLARQAGCARWPAMVGVLLWLAAPLAPEWAAAFRPDGGAIFFSLAAWWWYRRTGRAGWGVLGLLAAAFLQKQSTVSALLVVAAAEWQRAGWRNAGRVLAGWLGLVGPVLALMQWRTAGALGWNVWGSVAQPGDWSQAVVLASAALARGAPVWLGAVGAHRERDAWPLLAWCGVAWALAVVGSVKSGAWLNYYLEPLAVGCVLTAVCWERSRLQWLRAAWLGVALVAAVQWTEARRGAWMRGLAADDRAPAKLVERVFAAGEPVLVEDLYVAIRGDRLPYLLHGAQFVTLRRWGRFEDRELVRRIKAGEFRRIALTLPATVAEPRRQFPAEWLQAVAERYVLVETCSGGLQVYRPREGVE